MWKFLFSLVVIFGVGFAILTGSLFDFVPGDSSAVVLPVQAAKDLDSYFASAEARVSGMRAGLEKGIVWFDPSLRDRRPLCFLYLHGFSASRAEMAPLFDEVARDLNANLFYTRLTAHGLNDGEAFASVRAQDWIDDAREGLEVCRRIGDRTAFVGMSTGSALALHLAAENSQAKDIAALILISPNHYPADASARFVSGPLGKLVARYAIGEYRSFNPKNAEQTANWTTRYRSQGIVAMMDLVNYARSIDLTKISVAALTLYTHKDKVVNVDLIKSRHDELGSAFKRITDLPEANAHEIAGKIMDPAVVAPAKREIEQFLKEAI